MGNVADDAHTPAESKRTAYRRLAKDVAVGLVVAALVVSVMQVLQSRSQEGGGGRLPVGAVAADFELRSLDDSAPLRLSSLRGKPVLLNFWATWCPPCLRELPDIAELSAAAGDRYHVVTITDDSPTLIRAALASRGLELTVLWDAGGAVATRYGVSKLPTTVIIDAEGRYVHDFTGSASGDILRSHMNRLVPGD